MPAFDSKQLGKRAQSFIHSRTQDTVESTYVTLAEIDQTGISISRGDEDLECRYSKLAEQYKHIALSTRNAAWGKFCSSESNPFGMSQKNFTGKYFAPFEIKLELIPSEALRQHNLEFLTEHVFSKTAYTQNNNMDIEFTAPPDTPFTKVELRMVLNSLNDKKAPYPSSMPKTSDH